MDINEYLKKKERRIAKRMVRLRDVSVFDFNYVPDSPLLREELKLVIDALVRYEKTGIANNILIVGSRGCGKTLSLRYLQELFRARGMTIHYANCRLTNTSYKILAHLLRVRARGVSFDELAARFADTCQHKAVVILDEVDLLSPKDRDKDILYFLSRSTSNYMTILLSNNPGWATGLDGSIQSSLQPEHIFFRPYTVPQLADILQSRAREGIRIATGPTIKEIAARTAKHANSDVRIALKTLYYWALEPGVGLGDNFERARRDVVVDVVRSLNEKNLLILKAGAAGERQAKDVYESYRRLCIRYREEPYSYQHFHTSLTYLQSLGLTLLMSTKVNRSFAKTMQLTFPVEILDEFLRLRFGQ